MTIQAVRVSKTSFKKWGLHGPIEWALKNACQAENIRPIELHLDDVHGAPVDLTLWINAEEGGLEDEPNPNGQVVLQMQNCLKAGVTTPTEALLSGKELPELPIIKGVAVMTGAGGTDFPIEEFHCVVASLVGMHENLHNGLSE